VIGAAVKVMRIATGEESEDVPQPKSAAAELGRKGGLKGGAARAAKLTAEERKKIAQAAARRRWDSRK